MEKTAVIVLNYQTKDAALDCLESLKKSSYENLEIIAVDNNSGDGLGNALKDDQGVIFIQTGENLGYAGGNNIGIKRALENGAEYVFLLNPDTKVKKDTVAKLIQGMKTSGASVASPKILFSNADIIWYAGGILDTKNVMGLNRGVDEEDKGQYDKNEVTELLTGAALMIKTQVFKKIGFFDERYFLYYEDTDFCFRAGQAGFKLMYIADSLVYHKNAESTKLGSPKQDYYITRNRLLFASKFLSFRTRFALLREVLAHFDIDARRRALIDFILGRFCKGSF